MPRTPAPLTVQQLRLRGRYAWWNLTDPDGNVVAEFREEADARAFVALPQLEQALKKIASSVPVQHDFEGYANEYDNCVEIAQAALALVDGPSPKE